MSPEGEVRHSCIGQGLKGLGVSRSIRCRSISLFPPSELPRDQPPYPSTRPRPLRLFTGWHHAVRTLYTVSSASLRNRPSGLTSLQKSSALTHRPPRIWNLRASTGASHESRTGRRYTDRETWNDRRWRLGAKHPREPSKCWVESGECSMRTAYTPVVWMFGR